MTDRARVHLPHAAIAVVVGALVLIAASHVAGQNPAASSLTLLSKDGRRSLPVTVIGTQEFVSLDDVAATFQLTVREESGAITVSYRGRNVVLTTTQGLASVAGRLVSLPAPPARVGGRWFVPIDFIGRALALIYDQRLDLRRASHLVVIGDVRVPHVAVRYEPLANAARLTIDATPRTGTAVSQDNGRLLVRFEADALDVTLPAFQPQGFIAAVRLADPVTLAVDLGPRFATYRASTETIEQTTRLVIDVAGAEATTSAPPPARGAPPPPAATTPPPAELSGGGPRTAITTIALDPGHGGDDIGVKGPGGALEKDLTLAVARRVKAAMEARLGIRVLLTREDDRNIALDDRVAVANNSKADLFISLHANASFRGAPTGASIYMAAGDVAQPAAPPDRLPALSGGLRDLDLVEWHRAQLRYLNASAHFADAVRSAFQGRVPLDDHQPLTSAPFRILESANMPALLIDVGYLSNADDEQRLASAEFQNVVSQALVDAVVRFRDSTSQNPEESR